MGLSEDGIAAIVEVLDRAPRVLGRRLSLRDVIRMLERGEMLEETAEGSMRGDFKPRKAGTRSRGLVSTKESGHYLLQIMRQSGQLDAYPQLSSCRAGGQSYFHERFQVQPY